MVTPPDAPWHSTRARACWAIVQKLSKTSSAALSAQKTNTFIMSDPTMCDCRRPFDDSAFISLCATGQIESLSTLLEVEKRYSFASELTSRYRHELDTAAGTGTVSSSSTDWRYRISRWMLRASDEFSISRYVPIEQ